MLNDYYLEVVSALMEWEPHPRTQFLICLY